jgi:peptidoglycan/xylan/chitin deacetylase (PgdA/CDA1 family)
MRVAIMRAVGACIVIITACLVAYGAVRMQRAPGPVAASAAPPAETAPVAARPAAMPIRELSPQPAQVAVPSAAVPQPAQVAAAAQPASAAAPAPEAAPAAPLPSGCPGNPNALGLARVVEIDTTGGPGFGFEHFKAYDFLKQNEVVLTFDDGPWPGNTPAVLEALAKQCVKATFFPIGKHAMWHPEILRQVAEAGHSIGSHTWSHADLTKKTPEEAKEEIEKGLSAVHAALNGPSAPFFRFPALRHPPEMLTYLAQRNMAVFSTDMDSFDFKIRKPDQVIKSVMSKLKKRGKGIILMHDFQHVTAQALPELLNELKANGFRVVHVKPKDSVTTIAEYDAQLEKEFGGASATMKPTSSVVRTISGN